MKPTQKIITDGEKATINKLLLEKIPLAGIARVVGVSELWLQGYIGKLYAQVPDGLGIILPSETHFSGHLAEKFNGYSEKRAISKKKG